MNKWIGLGRMVADPESKSTNDGTTCCSFKIAVKKQSKPKDGQPDSDFFRITAWGKTAEFICGWFKKGQLILVEGHLKNSVWTDQQGVKRYADELYADKAYFADSKSENAAPQPTSYASQPAASAPQPAQSYAAARSEQANFENVEIDDALPF